MKEYGRSRNFQRTANSVLTVCVSSGDKRSDFQAAQLARCDCTSPDLLFLAHQVEIWFVKSSAT